jgi:glycosyltransferase involved in cell wall biosynthesis
VKPLRIGVDARELLGATTGVGRYLGELLLRWTAQRDSARRRFLLYSPEPLPIRLPPDSVDHRIISPGRRPGRGTWWEQMPLRRAVGEDRPDVFFAPAYTAPLLSGIPLALTIHDISFVAHPEWYRIREGLRRRWLTRRAAEAASVIFTDSEFSRTEIRAHFHLDRERIHVIPPGVSAHTATPSHPPTPRLPPSGREQGLASSGAHAASPWLPPSGGREPLILYVGSIFNRRRVPDLIGAFARVLREIPAARLAIVGDDRSWPPQPIHEIAAAHGVASRVDVKEYVPDAELADLYCRAAVFAFLSEYEGFGLTPLEALAANVPIVVLDTPVAREVYGDAAHYVALGDVRGAADTLSRLLRDPLAAAPAMRHAPAILARYSWDRCAAETLERIEGIAPR